VIKILLLFFIGLVSTFILISFSSDEGKLEPHVPGEFSLEALLMQLGDEELNHSIGTYDSAKAKLGEELIINGRTVYEGKLSKKISKHFVCTDCHNLTREFENLASESPKDRLEYAKKNNLNYLQGSTFYGIYNRTSFFNGDYLKKYGEMTLNARDTLENAIQLCSKYCSSGRYLKDWELEAMMHYFKKNDLKMSDFDFSDADLEIIRDAGSNTEKENAEFAKKLKSKYRQSYSATFLKPIQRDDRKYGEGGDVQNGEAIYEISCLSCHAYKRVTYLSLDKGKLSADMFWRNIRNYSDKSLYQIVRYGTHSKFGRRQYMPLFTKEKMSDEQLNDLVAYIKQLAGK